MNRDLASPASAEHRFLLRPDAWQPTLTGFPSSLPLLVGREREIVAVRDILQHDDTRLLTITGPGGMGKTRLALAVAAEVAGEYADGAVFVPLEAIRDPEAVVPTIAMALAVREAPGRSLLEILSAALRGREHLLVLDNFEHVVQAAPDVASLLESSPGLTVLVTSRTPLRVQAEQRYLTPPLRLPTTSQSTRGVLLRHDAIALFVERAHRVRPDFQFTPENAADIVALCQHLEGIPLAIELAAAWSHVLPPRALRSRLSQRLDVLSGGPADQPSRLQSMREAIDWSYDLLTDDEQQLFSRLGIFVGGFRLEAAEYVSSASMPATGTERKHASSSVLPTLARLVEASLVQQAVAADQEPRFMLLETVREFALEQLRASGEDDRVAYRHAQFFQDLVGINEPHLLGPDEARRQDELRMELGNLRAAMSWSIVHDPQIAVRISGLLWVFWIYVGLIEEGYQWTTSALATGAGTTLERANAMVTASAMAMLQADTERAAPLVQHASELVNSRDDPILRGRHRLISGGVAIQLGQIAEAERQFGLAVFDYSSATSTTDLGMRAWTRACQGMATSGTGDLAAAVGLYEQARQDVAQAGTHFVETLILCDFAGLLLDIGEPTRARALVTDIVRIATELKRIGHLGESWPVSQALLILAAIDVRERYFHRSARQFGAAEAIMNRLGVILTPFGQVRADLTKHHLDRELGSDTARAFREQGKAQPAQVIVDSLLSLAFQTAAVLSQEAEHVGPLSGRERQILLLIADGRSDREIAEALFISRKTASNHVTNILRKLGVNTRAAAVALSLRDPMRAAAATPDRSSGE